MEIVFASLIREYRKWKRSCCLRCFENRRWKINKLPECAFRNVIITEKYCDSYKNIYMKERVVKIRCSCDEKGKKKQPLAVKTHS